jgi:hypothetical protein
LVSFVVPSLFQVPSIRTTIRFMRVSLSWVTEIYLE